MEIAVVVIASGTVEQSPCIANVSENVHALPERG